MSDAKNQHWIPQFYLRYFAVPGFRKPKNAKIWVTDLFTGELRKEKIQEVAAVDYLYSHTKRDGARCYRMEDKLAKLESRIALLYSRMAEGFPNLEQAPGAKRFFALFLATLLLRHPANEDETKRIHRAVVDSHEKSRKDSPGVPRNAPMLHKDEQVKFDTSDFDDFKALDENQLKAMFTGLIDSTAIPLAQVLSQKCWIFFCADAPVFFTSDKPIVKQHDKLKVFGLGTPGVQVVFPISPTRVLWMTDRFQQDSQGFYPLAAAEAATFNLLTMGNARAFLLSHDQPDTRINEVRVLTDHAKGGA